VTLVSKGLGSGSDQSFAISFYGTFLSAGVNRFYPNRSAECPFTAEPGQWYHIAFTFDDATDQMALYVDGALAATATCASSVQYDDNPLVIGAELRGGQVINQFHEGSVDELALYNRALSPEEIHAIWQAGSRGKCRASLNPRILAQPQSRRVAVGEARLDFSVAAYGVPDPSYQWQKDGVPLVDGTRIAGVNTPTLTISNVQPEDAGVYTVTVSNVLGTATSAEAVLTVTPGPVILIPPRSQTVWEASSPVLSVVVEGNGPFSYQWQKDGVDLRGESNQSLFFPGVRPEDSGNYTVRVTSPAGSVAAAGATLTVKPIPEDSAVAYFGTRYLDARMIEDWPYTAWTNVIGVAIYGEHRFALNRDGTLMYNYGPIAPLLQPPAGLSNVVSLALNGDHALALKRDGTVVEWGHDLPASLVPPKGLSNVVAVACGAGHSLALKKDGTVVAWGVNDCFGGERVCGQAIVPEGLQGVVAIAAGYEHSLALKADGTVVAWGQDAAGQSSVPVGLSNVVAIAAGGHLSFWGWSMALRADGTVVCWGNISSPPSELTNVVAISAGQRHSVALKSDGTVVGWGDMHPPTDYDLGEPLAWVPPNLKDVVAISAGSGATLALMIGPPVVVTQPVSTFVTEHGTSCFYVNAYGSDIHYQWYANDLPVQGATNCLLVISNTLSAHEGNYYLVVTNRHGSDKSQTVRLALNTGEPGAVDSSFAPKQFAFGPPLALQPDGKLVLIGHVIWPYPSVMRLLPDGRLDTNFVTGTAKGPLLGSAQDPGRIDSIALQADGKILAAGDFTSYNGSPHKCLMRLNSDGTVDTAFLAGCSGPNEPLTVVRALPDGRIMVGGSFTEFNGVQRGGIARLNPDGTIDTSFLPNGGGVSGSYHTVFNIAVLPDGRMYIGGWFHEFNGVWVGYTSLCRLLPDGTLDTTFNAAAVPGYFGTILPMADGRVIVSGNVGDYFIVRLNSDGSIDNTFNRYAVNGHIQSVVQQPDGKLLVAGPFHNCGDSFRFGIARLLPNGELDPVFVEGGRPTEWHHFVTDMQLTDDGRVYVSGPFTSMSGIEVPGVARLFLGTLPTIVTHPVSQRIVVGQPVTFSVVATNEARLYYQWRRDGIDIPGATNATFTISSVETGHAGRYAVVVRNSTGTVTSQAAVLTPVVAPTVAVDLVAQILRAGSNTVLSVTFNGTPPFNYQWLFNGAPIPGATNATLVLNNVADNNTGYYSVRAGNEAGTVTSSPALIQVYYGSGYVYRWIYPDIPGGNVSDLIIDPSFPTYPSGIEKLTNGLASNLSEGETYGSLIQGYIIPPLTGNYTFWVCADDAAELWLSTNDSPANIRLASFCLLPVGTNAWEVYPEQRSAPVHLSAGQRYYFEVLHKENTGNDHVAIGWERPDGILQRPIPAAYLSPLLDPVTAPEIRQQPQPVVVVAGKQAAFSVTAEGVPPLRYQWQKDGVDLPRQTNATLVLGDVQTVNAGLYRVIVTNKFGRAVSQEAALTVHYSLTVTALAGGTVKRDPDLMSYAPGTKVSLSAEADAAHVFAGWSGAVSGTANPIEVVMDGNKVIVAVFWPIWTLTVTTNGPGGKVMREPALDYYVHGTQVQVTATPDAGYIFAGWSGNTNTSMNPLVLVMNRSWEIEANFQRVFYLNAIVSGNGTVQIDPAKPYYLPGESVNLTAVPAEGHGFAGWSGDNTSSSPTISFDMNSDKLVLANFKRLVTLAITNIGHGTVRVEPAAEQYLEGTTVQVTAEPQEGWQFIEWNRALSGSQNPVSLTLDGNKELEAVFKQLFRVTVEVLGSGTVTLVPNLPQYVDGTALTVVASAPSGYRFVGWGGDLEGSTTPATLVVDGDKHITAVFKPLWTLTVNSTRGGTVQKVPDLNRYVDGTAVELKAVPEQGYGFAGWSGDVTGFENPLTIVITNNMTVFAEFRTGWTLTVTPTRGGRVQRSPDLPVYPDGLLVTLTAIPDEGFVFVQWTGDIVSAANPRTFAMDGSKEIIANFIEIELQPPVIDMSGSQPTDDGFLITAKGKPGATFEVQVSEDLKQWTTLGTITIGEGSQSLLDPQALSADQRFYRLVEVP